MEWIRSAKNLQCEKPIVCAPDKAIMSMIVKSFAPNMAVRSDKVKFGCGSFPSACDLLDTCPSRLPSSTSKFGPLA